MAKMDKCKKTRIYQVARFILLVCLVYSIATKTREYTYLLLLLTFINECILKHKNKTYQRLRRKEYLEYINSDIKHVDTLNGVEFERYLKAHFINKGYKVQLTPPQGDYGVDLVIEKNGERVAVQAKRYNHEQGYKVNYKAVQEVAAGKAVYHCNKGLVVTNSFFTESAKELAKCNNIELWDRQEMIKQFKLLCAPKLRTYKEGYYSQ